MLKSRLSPEVLCWSHPIVRNVWEHLPVPGYPFRTRAVTEPVLLILIRTARYNLSNNHQGSWKETMYITDMSRKVHSMTGPWNEITHNERERDQTWGFALIGVRIGVLRDSQVNSLLVN